MVEIERKFLVLSDNFRAQTARKSLIAQGYLTTHPDRTVRIRIQGEAGFLTIKGKGSASGTTRLEWETELSLHDAKPLLEICEPGRIEKWRHEISFKGHVFEVDEFIGENQGLILAELELRYEHESFEKPDWLGEEVTGDERYYNAYLSKNPFTHWNR